MPPLATLPRTFLQRAGWRRRGARRASRRSVEEVRGRFRRYPSARAARSRRATPPEIRAPCGNRRYVGRSFPDTLAAEAPFVAENRAHDSSTGCGPGTISAIALSRLDSPGARFARSSRRFLRFAFLSRCLSWRFFSFCRLLTVVFDMGGSGTGAGWARNDSNGKRPNEEDNGSSASGD